MEEILECIPSLLDVSGAVNWLQENKYEAAKIKDFLQDEDGNCMLENYAFALEAIEANINSPFIVDLFDVYDKINYLPNDSTSIAAKKFNCVYKKLTENPKFKTLFTDVFGENKDIDITIKLNENPAWTDSQLAVTEWDGISNNTHMIMAFNKNVINQNHPLIIASTIVHEAIHAYFNLKIKECDENITINEVNTQGLDDLLNNYNYTCGFTDQHTLMYQNMIPVIKDIVNDLFPILVASEDTNPIQNFYIPPNGDLHVFTWENALHFMSLDGLQGATSFNPTSNIVTNTQDANYLLQQYYDRVNSNAFNKSTCEE